MRILSLPIFLAYLGITLAADTADTKSAGDGVTKAQGPPPFFLQDSTDSLCLAGEDFRRCSIDTLFFVVGSPGSYQIHKRPIEETDVDPDGTCLSKKSCDTIDASKKDSVDAIDVKLAKCTHCGAKAWNIHGDSNTGYVLTESSSGIQQCLIRPKGSKQVKLAPCDSADHPYTPLQLQFASAADIEAMSSPGARLIGAASDGDKKLVQKLLKEEKIEVNVRDWDELTPLIPAASAGHLDVVKLLLKEGADVNAKDKDGITALMEASIMGHTKIVDLLLKEGAEVDAPANSGVTALWLASGEGKVDVMKSLLKKDADANNARSDNISALMTASVGGHTEAVKLLLENGADARFADGEGVTPLMNAAENGTAPVLKLLVESASAKKDEETKGKYVDLVSNTGFTALIIASAHGHTGAIEYLLKDAKADVNAMHETHVTPLMYAAASGHIDAMKLLLDVGKVDVNELHTNGGSALLEAATGGAGEAMKFLLEKGAKPDLIDLDGVTPLHAVTSKGDYDGTVALLEALKKSMSKDELVAHINLPSHSGGTAVMFAAAGGHPKCTKLMIEEGADVNAIATATPDYLEKLAKMIEEGTVDPNEDPHVDGVTGVHVAAEEGHLECVNLLIEAGADVTVLDEEERTPLLLAVKGNYGEVASALVKAGADPNTPYVDEEGESHNLLMDSIIVENADFALLLIEHGADLYYKDDHKVTTLLQAAHRGITNVTEALLDKHAASPKAGEENWVDDASDEGVTPLLAAASEGHITILNKLLSTGKADVNAKDKEGTNSLMAAAARGHLECIQSLIKTDGIDVNAQNVDGHTALMFAYNGKNQVETLWERYSQFVSDAKLEKSAGAEGSEAAKDADGADKKDIDDGGTGPLIQEALKNHTTLVDLLLNAGADTTLKDKEGHTAKDFDFQPDADSELLEKEEKAEKARDESKNEL
jgi:serine/threonine-protein phosphatase 6 regulatory ankyrin repeat subunit B